MTKKEIVKRISERADLTQLKTKEVVQMTFDAIIETLVEEGRIELRNFGVFEVKRRKPRRARNPRTNEPVDVEAKFVVTFQPGKVMEEQVRQMDPPAARTPTDYDDEDDEDLDGETGDLFRTPVRVGGARSQPAKPSRNGDSSIDEIMKSDLPMKPR